MPNDAGCPVERHGAKEMTYRTDELPDWPIQIMDDSASTNGTTVHEISSIPTRDRGHLIQIQLGLTERSSIESFEKFVSDHSHRALTRALSESLGASTKRRPDRVEIIFSIDGDRRIDSVVDLRESYGTPFVDAAAEKLTFKDWWIVFQPMTREDHRLALPLYSMCRNHEVYWAVACSVSTDPWLDSLLSDTRGMLLWTHQWEEVLRQGGGLKPLEATEVMHGIRLGRADARELLRSTLYEPTGQTLSSLFEQRSPFEIPIGRVDHVAGDWFWNRLGAGFLPLDPAPRTASRGDQ